MILFSMLCAAIQKSNLLSEAVFTYVPVLLVCAFLFYSVYFSQRRYQRYLDRSLGHMDALEKKSDRMIELLEELAKRK